MPKLRVLLLPLISLLLLTACMPEQATIIIITSTPSGASNNLVAQVTDAYPPIATTETTVLMQPTANPAQPAIPVASEHVVQSGETLSAIAQRYNLTVDAILALNSIPNPNILSVGQVIRLPEPPSDYTPNFKIIPDSRLVRSPGSSAFDVGTFISQQEGYIRRASDLVMTRTANGANLPRLLAATHVVERVSLEFSVDSRLLLALLEYRAGWLSNPDPREDLLSHPLISAEASDPIDRSGLYKQLAWAANELNRGYYGWKYRGSNIIQFADGTRALYNPELNSASVGVQHFLSLAGTPYSTWNYEVSTNGLYQTYVRLFGDPFLNAVEPLVPVNIQQPLLTLPFETDDEWRYTGGPHGGWGTGSAWSSLDFAPSPENPAATLCYTSDLWVTAVVSGVIARVGDGVLVIDLDGDGDESTGWTINYLHLSADPSVHQGQQVTHGQRLGHVSCAGGFSTATHLHIGRRYNGEWLPADCQQCFAGVQIPPFILADWEAISITGQEYQGYMQNSAGQRIQAEQGRYTDINIIVGQ